MKVIKEINQSRLQKKLLTNIALNVELLYNDSDYEISEYDVQAMISLFLKRFLRNTDLIISREIFGRFDCAISKKKDKTEIPQILYEIKTFLKRKEKLNTKSAYTKIEKDIIKLKKGIGKYKEAKAYLIIVCNKRTLNVDFLKEFNFIKNHIENLKKWTILETNDEEIKVVKLRPSRKKLIEQAYALSWEIM